MENRHVMQGQGFYNANSAPQGSAVSLGLAMWERACHEAELSEVIRVADLGASQGRNSVIAMHSMCRCLRTRSQAPIEVVHQDLPANDFNSLHVLIHSDDGYLSSYPEVYVYTLGGSFFHRLFPAGQLNLVWCANAAHWLSRVPVPLGDHIWAPLSARRTAWKAQADQDWADFTRCRGIEARPGAQLMMIGSLGDDQGMTGAEGLMQTVYEVLQEFLPTEQLAALAIPTFHRTLEEWTTGIDSRWELIESEANKIEDPNFSVPAEQRVDRIAGFFQAAAHGALLGGDPAEWADFYRVLKERVSADPERMRSDRRVVLLRLRRRPD